MTPPPATEPAALARERAINLLAALLARQKGQPVEARYLKIGGFGTWFECDKEMEIQFGDGYEYRPKLREPEPEPDPFIELKAAHAAGKTIQIKSWDGDKWSDCEPQWARNRQYRIKPEGDWREHDGGPCPVADDTLVDIKYRSGQTDFVNAGNAAWDHGWGEASIIAWRPAAPQSRRVPLTAAQVPPGSAVQQPNESHWQLILRVDDDYIYIMDTDDTLNPISYDMLFINNWLIRRPGEDWMECCTREAAPEAS